ncbi:cobalt transporter CbiM [Thauera linaloolentis]|uniref:cobalt transporter CbiM n=1 Tax=Thauera linaloolentis TaxID=76112 RepID=UPI00048E0FDC|nr:cobalt transporter CbiM [Thauera linaloolentis]MCM8567505.1 cobalt transporter CbiM [Thauera linaloolentis]
MHLADGVLSTPVLLACAALSAAGVARGLGRLREEQLPLAALLGAAFFAASTIHVPVGAGSVHLVLNGLAGLLLGWAVFPVLCVALLLQAALFSFGGFAVLGANLLGVALPGVAAHYLLRARLGHGTPHTQAMLAGAACGVIGIGGAVALIGGLLALSGGRAFGELIVLFSLAHLPVMAVDAAIGAFTVAALVRMMPQALAPVRP